jgi:Cys-rich repeat protein
MGKRTLIALALLVTAGCSSSDQPVTFPDGGEVCAAGSHTCAAGTRCVNSYCVTTCTGGAACPGGEFCGGAAFPDDVCAPVQARTCALVTDCPLAQQCAIGHCVSFELGVDGGLDLCTVNSAQDKCAPDAVCTNVNGQQRCLGLSLCGQDGGCPTGANSQACNLEPDGGHIIAGKGAICLLTQCATNLDCASGRVCSHAAATAWGTCQSGGTGDPCATDADCAAGAICEAHDPGDGGPVVRTCRCVTATGGVCK